LRGFGASARGRRRCFSCFSVEELASVAGVSKCTLYKLFPGKDQLVAAYLRQARENLGTNERYLLRGDLAPRERLLALFRRPRASAPFRGCPFHNAAVELAGPDHPARPVVLAHKQAVVRLLADTARQGGAADPARPPAGRALGGRGRPGHLHRRRGAVRLRRPVAAALLDQAIPPTAVPETGNL
jgi:AcrR family transcriptional regulator